MPDENQVEGWSLPSALGVLRQRILIVLLCAIIVPLGALGYSLMQEKQYTATASLLFRISDIQPGQFVDQNRRAATNLDLVTLRTVSERTSKALDGALSSDQVQDRIAATSKLQSDVVKVEATDRHPTLAARVANTFARQYIAFRASADRKEALTEASRLRRELNGLPASQRNGEEGAALRQQILAQQASAASPGNVELVQRADVPSSPSSPRTTLNVVAGGIIGLLLGIGLAFLTDRLDRRLKTPDDLEDAMGMPILGQVPESLLLALHGNALQDPTSAEAEAFRTIRANLRYFNAGHRDIRTVLVTSISPEDGKSTVALSLASAAAGAGARTLLVEADLRNPSLARRVGFNANGGLSSVLIGDAALYDTRQHVPLVHHAGDGQASGVGVDVLLAGLIPPNPGGLIESPRMDELLAEAERDYDLTIIDTPPIPLVSDAIPLIERVQGVIIVGRLGTTTRDEAQKLAEQLRKLDAPVLGLIANFAPPPDPQYYQYLYGHELSRT